MNAKQRQAQKTLLDNICKAIEEVHKELVPVDEIHIPASHRSLIPKDFITNKSMRIMYGSGEAYVTSVKPYRIVQAKIELPEL